MEETY